jgi:hypothetical protein
MPLAKTQRAQSKSFTKKSFKVTNCDFKFNCLLIPSCPSLVVVQRKSRFFVRGPVKFEDYLTGVVIYPA